MSQHKVHTVDVFAEDRYSGNQLAVFQDTANLSDEERLALTREMNFSEATFIESTEPTGDGYEVRIFDPAEEIPFAGHPTLGTAFVLREFIRDDRPDEITLELGVGEILVWVELDEAGQEYYWMEQIRPTFDAELDRALFPEILGLEAADIREGYPIYLVSTGLPTVIVPLDSLDAVRRATVQREPYYRSLIEPYGNLNLLVFAPETYDDDADLNVRVFAEASGVPEDPATGSSNGCLAAYLVETNFFGHTDLEVTVEQGYEMARPSRLHLRGSKADDDIRIQVGGRVIPVIEGYLL